MIEVQNLVKMYGGHMAVNHLSFTIEKGKIYGFLGPNGAGKSTTMNIMTGYLGATEGKVLINGKDILKEPKEAKKCMGYLPELPPLYMEMTVLEYLEFAAKLKKIPKQDCEGQIQEVIQLTKLEEVKNRLIANLSKGYKQRVGLAQAILGFPEIIILDEPTVGLDPKQIIEIRELIRKFAKNHTVILSSHILAEVREVCDYIMIIANGKLVASDTPENLERKIGSSGHITIETRAGQNQVEKILKEIPFIQETEYETAQGVTTVKIISEDNRDIREELFFAFAEHKTALISLTMEKTTLEEIFLELTQENCIEGAVDAGMEEKLQEDGQVTKVVKKLQDTAKSCQDTRDDMVENEKESEGQTDGSNI